MFAQMEEEIDAEISGEQPPPKRTRPMPYRAPVDMMSLDEMVSNINIKCTQRRATSEQGYTHIKNGSFGIDENKQTNKRYSYTINKQIRTLLILISVKSVICSM